jgi:putative ABC transport system permease protein
LLAVAAGVAVAVALVAGLGGFITSSQATMTARATREVAVDWQVQVAPANKPNAVLTATRAAAGTTAALPVEFGEVPGFSASPGATQQTTGAGVVLGLPRGYRATFPDEIRTLVGDPTGALIAQQTAANLQVEAGDAIRVNLPSGTVGPVRVDAVVDLPQANSLFQIVGAASQAQPIAPPDNVVALPRASFDQLFRAEIASRSQAISYQIHVRRLHSLPGSPAAAYAAETGQARNLEVALTGGGVVGDNLGAALDAARKDAAYSQVLFLFLGTPGAVLAGLLTASFAAAGTDRRRRDQALLRSRGATRSVVLRMVAIEALVVGALGAATGLMLALISTSWLFGASLRAATSSVWLPAAGAAGLIVALLTVVLPVRRDLKEANVAAARRVVEQVDRAPLVLRLGLDLIALALSAWVFWIASRNQYTLVLAPEGVPSISVSYWALAAPLLLWLGGALLCWRVVDGLLRHGQRPLSLAFRPLAGRLAPIVASAMARRRGRLVRATVLLAVAVSFAISTATFNATYQAQAEVDAVLTNGADVAISSSPGSGLPPATRARIAATSGVSSVEPLQHRFAYVGNDLQDLYGVEPATIVNATSLQDAYFVGGTAQGLMDMLSQRSDGVLVSEETVRDFQLIPGDQLRLRLQDAATGAYKPVPFTYIGVAKEFPTAPSDSFLVANADYITSQTGSPAVSTYLVDTAGRSPATVAEDLRHTMGPDATITDIGTVRGHIGSSLTSVNLDGLTRIELAAAALLAAAAGGLVLGLGLTERRRNFAIIRALGAKGRQLAGFVTTDAVVVLTGGLAAGGLLGWGLSVTLVKVLTGVFDPPPAAMTVPTGYLGTLVVVIVAALSTAVAWTYRWASRPAPDALRDS